MAKINFLNDVERVVRLDEKGRVVLSPDDKILLGDVAEQNFKLWFLTFGLKQMPKTFVELVANYNYCERLDRQVTQFQAMDDVARAKALKELGSKEPEQKSTLETILNRVKAGERFRDALAELHNKYGTFKKNTTIDLYTLDLNINEK